MVENQEMDDVLLPTVNLVHTPPYVTVHLRLSYDDMTG